MALNVDEDRAKERFEEIALKHHLDPEILQRIMLERNKGYNNAEIAERLDLNKNTVGKYVSALNTMSDEDLKTLLLIIALIGAGAFLLAFAATMMKTSEGN
ncbi:DNA-binding NarL/FixJ family response regulator [Methanomicrobium sp. W14]|uniref:hypothetical protein n=1 Tax=Methanomicrobium sp. W14 TaxID=2817839 RepID=UPI001AE60639|nr:hypothetical protein [Methanomicrobium sp. W14]MBP2132954.1 DNA-binding NarL/FixJ family response regulator [Methanomicrobium sp. W14]